MTFSLRRIALATACLMLAGQAMAAEPKRPECIAPASPGGGFDLTCKLVQSALVEQKILSKPMRVTYMPGGVGAVAYNAVVAQRPADAGTLVAWSSGSLLNLAQGKFGRFDENAVRWLAAVGTSYGAIAVKNDSPYKTLDDLVAALKKDPSKVPKPPASTRVTCVMSPLKAVEKLPRRCWVATSRWAVPTSPTPCRTSRAVICAYWRCSLKSVWTSRK
jgi:putative tricarboxylic transport membrane protein